MGDLTVDPRVGRLEDLTVGPKVGRLEDLKVDRLGDPTVGPKVGRLGGQRAEPSRGPLPVLKEERGAWTPLLGERRVLSQPLPRPGRRLDVASTRTAKDRWLAERKRALGLVERSGASEGLDLVRRIPTEVFWARLLPLLPNRLE